MRRNENKEERSPLYVILKLPPRHINQRGKKRNYKYEVFSNEWMKKDDVYTHIYIKADLSSVLSLRKLFSRVFYDLFRVFSVFDTNAESQNTLAAVIYVWIRRNNTFNLCDFLVNLSLIFNNNKSLEAGGLFIIVYCTIWCYKLKSYKVYTPFLNILLFFKYNL